MLGCSDDDAGHSLAVGHDLVSDLVSFENL